jgi:mono/diheme cytochrome c family protein
MRPTALLPFGSLMLAFALVCIPTESRTAKAEPSSLPDTKARSGKLQYNRDVRPILAENCFACHGPDSGSRKAGLRLDQRDAAIKKGAIEPGKPEKSEIITRVNLPQNDDQLMPPLKSHKQLTKEQKAILTAWIKEGADYESHWSFISPKQPVAPTTKNDGWVKQPLDAFILAELDKRGLTTAPAADKRTLARRVSLDLVGLPPTPEELNAFLNDTTPNAYETYVDKLLSKPQWGEHRGRYWLDYARYADTHGIHFDNYRENWAYRDWVISAFNQNMKFDQFTTEQLAGDLLENPTLDQRIATGFNRSHITTNEGGAINEEYLVLYTRDRIETASQVFLGLTAGCAVCHDHKFDPISQRDFYSMAAFFNNTTQGAMDGNIKDTPPILFVPAKEDREKYTAFKAKLTEAENAINTRKVIARKEFDAWLAKAKPTDVQATADGLTLAAWLDEGAGDSIRYVWNGKPMTAKLPKGFDWRAGAYADSKALGLKPDGAGALEFPPEVGEFEADQPFSYAAWVQVPQRGQNAAIFAKMDNDKAYRGWDLWLENDKLAAHVVGAWPKDGFKVATKNAIDPNKFQHVAVTYDGSRSPFGMKLYVNGESQPLTYFAADKFVNPGDKLDKIPAGTIKTDKPLTIGRRTPNQAVRSVAIQDLRLYKRMLTVTEVGDLFGSLKASTLLNMTADKRNAKDVDSLFTWWVTSRDPKSAELATAFNTLKGEETGFKARGTTAPVSSERTTPAEAFILKRGDYDKRGDKVGPEVPKALPTMAKELPRNRLGFAKWLLTKEHPLTARVTVNRFWQELFGQGLVRSSGDFGITGDLPSHPELLDHLALDFQKDWNIKRFFRMVVMSNTYQQAAIANKEKIEKDPANVYLSRGPRYRMDAEMIRDYALAVSGLLVPKIGGPSVKPYQPEGVWEAVAMIGSNTRDYKQDNGESLYRRGMYTFWKRAAPPAALEVMNAPNRETCAVRRERTNTPLQALLTLNDIQFVEAARVLAEKAIKSGSTNEARFDYISERVLCRKLSNNEKPIVEETLRDLLNEFKAKPDGAKKLLTTGEYKSDPKLDTSELAAWTMLCNQLLNLDEVLNK